MLMHNEKSSFLPDVTVLDGLWDFAFLGGGDPDAITLQIPTPAEKMLVPSAFDALPAYAGKRGAAIYRTELVIPSGRPARLEFGAVSMWARIFVDGEMLAEHACGYAPFTVDVSPSHRNRRELIVLVDNRFDFDRVPMHEDYFDFYQYGGILRSVILRLLPESGPFIEALQVTPTARYRQGEVELKLVLGDSPATTLDFTTCFDNGATISHQVEMLERCVTIPLRVPDPKLWSPQMPHLHRLGVSLLGADGVVIEEREIRFGLREIAVRDGALWLNGERLILKGFNRHEWHPNFGPCTPTLQMIADLQILRDLGCNFVRGCHYPQDQRFLDLCDELGFLVWEENLGWGQREKTFASPKFRRDHMTSLRAMVHASVNHPSVILWGFLNEAGTDQEYCRPIFEESVRILREIDPSRPITYASMFAETDRFFDLADVISINIYPGWYNCEGMERPLDLIAPHLEKCIASIDARGFGHKPVLVSEIGAEGLYGWHDTHNDFFTEEYQAEYLRTACRAALGHPRCCGIALWHFSDVRTYSGGLSLKRPRAFNNKGTLDEYRRPKVAYRAVREVFHQLK